MHFRFNLSFIRACKSQVTENNGNLKQKSLVGENINEESLETNLSTQVKNQLKNTDQIKKNPIKNLSPEIN